MSQAQYAGPLHRWPGEISRFFWLHLLARRRFARGAGAARTAGDNAGAAGGELTLSLTTLPSRLPWIFPTLNSLLDQTQAPRRIVLAIPRRAERDPRPYRVPEGLRRHPRIELLEADRDWGPATKLLPLLQRLPADSQAPIVIVDDDNVYPRGFVATLAAAARAWPDAALGLRGWPVPTSGRWADSREFFGTRIGAPVATDVLTGCGGVLVRPAFFDAAVFDYADAPVGARFADDLWFSGHLARRGVRRLVVPTTERYVYLPTLATWRGVGLDRSENRDGGNNDRLLAHFARDWDRGAVVGGVHA
ncbi:hypothetical protein [Opitutus sp. ER46]|uniref:hypothetical protein n=1 Tax=Opitutus sp. ER46 TaxID=2161864 RepID=UPI000D4E606B|nr:hypothetical protein [Opitutus sp. ER46]PTX91652.1 hypothetical protein DB354_17435 [Opitutus sp. ER46]